MANKMEWYGWVAFLLVTIGALNWGFVAWFNWNLVDWIFGVKSVLATIVYSLVAISGLYGIFSIAKLAK
jgi:uncharacterized membrane protein YuzA (DUF378 family)